MMIQGYVTGEIPADSLSLDKSELSRRLSTPIGYTDETLSKLQETIQGVIDCRYAAVRVSTLLFDSWECEELKRLTKGCDEAWVFAVTLGVLVDRWLQKEKIKGTSRLFAADALASAYAEAAAEQVDRMLRETRAATRRFSPGYGKVPLSLQTKVLNLVRKSGFYSITIGDRLLMTPTKSITAIMGIKA